MLQKRIAHLWKVEEKAEKMPYSTLDLVKNFLCYQQLRKNDKFFATPFSKEHTMNVVKN